MGIAPTRAGRSAPVRPPWPVLAVALAVVALVVVQRGLLHLGGTSAGARVGSGVAATQARALPPFDGVELAGTSDVVIRVGGAQSVVVHADDNLLARITTAVKGGRLVVDATRGRLRPRTPLRVDVTVPALREIRLSGTGAIVAAGVDGRRLVVAISGSGVVQVAGRAVQLEVTVSGAGSARLEPLVASDVHAVVSGSGQIEVTATGRLDAAVPGSGLIFYRGRPAHVTTSVTGSGRVLRADRPAGRPPRPRRPQGRGTSPRSRSRPRSRSARPQRSARNAPSRATCSATLREPSASSARPLAACQATNSSRSAGGEPAEVVVRAASALGEVEREQPERALVRDPRRHGCPATQPPAKASRASATVMRPAAPAVRWRAEASRVRGPSPAGTSRQ